MFNSLSVSLYNTLLLNRRNVLFNDPLNTFYLRLYGVRHMVKDHSDSERGNPLPPHGLLFPINGKGSFICTIPQIRYHSLCYTSRGALAGMRNRSCYLKYLQTNLIITIMFINPHGENFDMIRRLFYVSTTQRAIAAGCSLFVRVAVFEL